MTFKRKFYLDKADAKIAGVCSGFAAYIGVEALWVRVAAVLLTLFVSFFTIPVYIVTALLAENRPIYRIGDKDDGSWLDRNAHRSDTAARVRDIERGASGNAQRFATNATLSAEIDRLR